MMLKKEELDRYDQDGYLVLRNVIDRSVLDPMCHSIDGFVEEQIMELYAAGKISNLHSDAPFEKRWAMVCRDNSLQEGENRVVQWGAGSGLFNETIYNLLVERRLTDIIASILGPEVWAHGDYWIRPKVPADPITTLAWHQDSNYYLGKGDSDYYEGDMTVTQGVVLTAWVPLVDVSEHNGCLKLVRGSHRHGSIAARRNELKQWSPVKKATEYGTVINASMQLGDVLIFNNLTMHASGNNNSDHIRWNIDLRYSPTGHAVDWHKLGNELDARFPGFVARSDDSAKVMSWKQWQDKWNISLTAK